MTTNCRNRLEFDNKKEALLIKKMFTKLFFVADLIYLEICLYSLITLTQLT